MSLITTTSYVAVFSAGTIIGVVSTYYLLKFQHKPKHKTDPVWSNGMEQRYEAIKNYNITQRCS